MFRVSFVAIAKGLIKVLLYFHDSGNSFVLTFNGLLLMESCLNNKSHCFYDPKHVYRCCYDQYRWTAIAVTSQQVKTS